MAYVDAVGLKTLNDTEGHAVGDELLKRVVQLIRTHLRPYDLIIRLGGDEFLCAMSNMSLREARRRFGASPPRPPPHLTPTHRRRPRQRPPGVRDHRRTGRRARAAEASGRPGQSTPARAGILRSSTRVTAPSEAEETSAAYLANTPSRYRGGGGDQSRSRSAIS